MDKSKELVVGLLGKARSSALWFVLPSLAVVAAIGVTIAGYEPLMFDPSLYQAKQAIASELNTADDPEQEKEDKPTSLSASDSDGEQQLTDGTWTGYAVCGEGNPDGWSPYYVGVTVRVAGGKPTGITRIWGSATGDAGSQALSWNESESGRYLDWAIVGKGSAAGVQSQINGQLAAAGRVSGVDTVSGATFSSRAIAQAYGAALSKAAQAAGSTAPTTPTTPPAHDPQQPSPSEPGSPDDDDPQQVDPGEDEDVSTAKFADGTWTGYAVCGEGNEDDWSPYYVAVTVQVKGGVVKKIKGFEGTARADVGSAKLTWNADESQRYLDWAALGRTRGGVTYKGVLDQAKEAIKTGAALGSIDVVSGATFSSNAIVKAYYATLKKSAEAAGSTYEEPEPDPEPDPSGDGQDDHGSGDGDQGDQDSGENSDGQQDTHGGEDDTGDGDNPGDGEADTGEPERRPALIDGDYTGHGWCEDPTYEDDWDPYYVLVSIEVRDGSVARIASIRGDSEGEVDPDFRFDLYNATYLNRAIKGTAREKGLLEQIQAKLDAGQDASKVDVVSGATFSSNAIIEGYAHAVAQAGGPE